MTQPRSQEAESQEIGAFFAAANGAMAVVTAYSGQERSGCLVGFHAQCSIEPPRYMVFLSKANHTYRVALGSECLGVCLLATDQAPIARLFGGETADDGTDKFTQCQWWEHRSAALLTGARAWLVGTVIERFDAGDHVGFLLDVAAVGGDETKGVLRYSVTTGIEPGHTS